jgi:hypothetical protein
MMMMIMMMLSDAMMMMSGAMMMMSGAMMMMMMMSELISMYPHGTPNASTLPTKGVTYINGTR